ncbi:hypothetical protein TcCL_NonESM09479, partial [Trypanosoma cruzi]
RVLFQSGKIKKVKQNLRGTQLIFSVRSRKIDTPWLKRLPQPHTVPKAEAAVFLHPQEVIISLPSTVGKDKSASKEIPLLSLTFSLFKGDALCVALLHALLFVGSLAAGVGARGPWMLSHRCTHRWCWAS